MLPGLVALLVVEKGDLLALLYGCYSEYSGGLYRDGKVKYDGKRGREAHKPPRVMSKNTLCSEDTMSVII